jgi:CheY-like chemotaxis protein
VLSATDTGIGMDAATQAQIFEPFFTTKERGKGTGLGLAMVYGIVRQSNGAILVESTPGRGTRFEVYLPRVAATSEAGATEAPHATAHTRGSGTILVVEDEEALLAVIGRILTDHGYTALTASGGEEAGRIAREHQGPIDLLLTDVVMPGANGPEVAAALRRGRPALPVLYMSGYAADVFGAVGLDSEDVDIFRKPFTAEDLVARLEALLGTKAQAPSASSPRAARG